MVTVPAIRRRLDARSAGTGPRARVGRICVLVLAGSLLAISLSSATRASVDDQANRDGGVAAGPSATTTAPVYRGSIAWSLDHRLSEQGAGGGFRDVTSFGGRFVASRSGGGVATSVDGVAWTKIDGPRGVTLAAGPTTLVMIGGDRPWWSTDGDTWRVAGSTGQATPRGAVTAVGSGFLAIGTTGADRASAWLSADGSTWTEVGPSAAFERFCPSAVASSPTGLIVAVGDDCYPLVSHPVVVVSGDGGHRWQRAPAQSAFVEEGSLTAVVRGRSGFVATGPDVPDVYPGRVGASMYVSADGLHWRRVAFFSAIDTTRAHPGVLLAPIDRGYLAVTTDQPPRAFVSVDGAHWTIAPSLPRASEDESTIATVEAVAANGDVVAIVGREQCAGFDQSTPPTSGALVWRGQLTYATPSPGRVDVPPPTPVVPSPSRPPRQPAFPGSVTWAARMLPVSLPPRADASLDARPVDVVRWGTGFAVLGSESNQDYDPRTGALTGMERTVVWTSPDGAAWMERVLPVGCAGERIAATGSAIVVVWNDASHGIPICATRDGVTWQRAVAFPGDLRYLFDVVGTSAGFLLVQTRNGHAGGSQMATWASSDGLRWRVASRWTTSSYLEAIGSGARGVVGLGSTWSGPVLTGRTVAIRSTTGASWSRSGVLSAFDPRSNPVSVIARGSGYLAVGGYQPRARSGGGAWTSPDGLAWTRVLYVPASTGSTSFQAVGPIGPGYAIVGLVAPRSQEPPDVPTVWMSPDGTHWRTGVALASAEPGDWKVAAAGNGRRLVVTGWASAAGVADPFVWIATYRP